MKLRLSIAEKARRIEIKTRRLVSNILVGGSRSTKPGFGFDFDQIRPYQLGDDIRFIDWGASSRSNKLLVKQYHQEQDRTVILLVDISCSSFYSSSRTSKKNIMAQIAGTLAFVGNYADDALSLILFSDTVELFIPPRKGKKHLHFIINQLFEYRPKGKKTNISSAIEYVAAMRYEGLVVFVISDFIDDSFHKSFSIVARKHTIVPIVCLDPLERALPAIGFLSVVDHETGQVIELDLRKKGVNRINFLLERRLVQHKGFFASCGVKMLVINTSKDFFDDLVIFFCGYV